MKDDSSASKTTVDSSGNGQTQRKRPHTVDTTETGQSKRSKKSKQRSSSESLLATTVHDHATNKKDTRTSNDNDQPIVKRTKRKEQVIPTGSLSSSESEANDSNHMPFQVIHNTLRKVNHKTEDEVLRSLNRLAQRKLLDSLSAVRPESTSTTAILDEQLKRYKEVQARVVNLEKAHGEMIQEHARCKCIGVLVSQMEVIGKEFNKKDLMDEVQKTNDFLGM